MARKQELERQARERLLPKLTATEYGTAKQCDRRWNPLVREQRKRAKEERVKTPASGS